MVLSAIISLLGFRYESIRTVTVSPAKESGQLGGRSDVSSVIYISDG